MVDWAVFKALMAKFLTLWIPHDNTQNFPYIAHKEWLKRLDTQSNKPTNTNSKKVPKVVEPTNKKTLI